jgi:hypothetical protein
MAKYVTLRVAARVDENGDADAAESLAKTVFEPDQSPVDTGLLNHHGVTLYRVPDVRSLGFFAKWKD